MKVGTSSSPTGNAVTLGQGTIVSRLLGFARDASIAALLGGGWLADALLVAFRLPNIARALLADGAFAYALVPAYVSVKATDPQRAWVFARSITCSLFVFFGGIALLGALFSDHIAILLAPGFYGMPFLLEMASAFMALCLLALPFISGAAVSGAILMAEGHFRPPAYASAVFNAVILLSVGLAFVVFGTGGSHAPYMLCCGVLVAGMAQWGYQARYLRRLGFSLSGSVAFTDPALRHSLRALPQSVFGVGGHHANVLLATFFASFLAEGSISSLYFAERLIGFPLGVIGASMGLAALSDLSALATSFTSAPTATPEDIASGKALFSERLARASRIVLFFALPATVGTACLATPLTSAIFGYGEFGHTALAQTSLALLAYLVGLPALSLARPLLAGLGALNDVKAPLWAAMAGFIAAGVLGITSLWIQASWGPALAVSLAAWVTVAFLVRFLRKRGHDPLPGAVWTLKVLIASGLMGACVLWMAGLWDSNFGKVAMIPVGVAVYFAAAFAVRLDECTLVLPMVRRTFFRRQHPG